MQAAGCGENSRSLSLSYGFTASLRRVNRQPSCIGEKKNEEKNTQNGQGYDNNHRIHTEFESVRNPVEEKLTDASLLRTWAGLIRTDVRVVGSKILVSCLHMLHIYLHYCCTLTIDLPDARVTNGIVCYHRDRKEPSVTHLLDLSNGRLLTRLLLEDDIGYYI